jgi:hypothetical protein
MRTRKSNKENEKKNGEKNTRTFNISVSLSFFSVNNRNYQALICVLWSISMRRKKNASDWYVEYKWWATSKAKQRESERLTFTNDQSFYYQSRRTWIWMNEMYLCPWNDITRKSNFTFHYHLSSGEVKEYGGFLLSFTLMKKKITKIKLIPACVRDL